MELLVVIGIAALLATIVVGVIAKVKAAAYRSATGASIAALSGAIEAYYQNFKAYPGPLSDETVCGVGGAWPSGITQRPTMSENLVLGLAGGLGYNSSGQLVFAKEFVGRGPRKLVDSASSSTPMAPFYGANDRITSYSPANSAWWGLVIGNNMVPLNTDSNIPEYLDAYPEAMPILYYRAHRNAGGVASDSGNLAQYDVRQNDAYLNQQLGLTHGTQHGLRQAGSYDAPEKRIGAGYRYNLTTFMASLNDSTQPRMRDGYVLVAAGSDRIYGTDDDIVSFGKVAP